MASGRHGAQPGMLHSVQHDNFAQAVTHFWPHFRAISFSQAKIILLLLDGLCGQGFVSFASLEDRSHEARGVSGQKVSQGGFFDLTPIADLGIV